MFNRARRFFSQFSMLFLFSLNIFFIILLVLAVFAVAGYMAYRAGAFTDNIAAAAAGFFLILFLASFVIGISVILGGNKNVLKPIRKMAAAMKELANGNFEVQVDLDGPYYPREIHEISESLNLTVRELRGVEMLRKDFINDFSHEFRTPIVSLGGFARLILDGNISQEERDEYLRIIAAESDRLAALASNVLNLAKLENQSIVTEKSVFNAGEQVRQAILMMEAKWLEKELNLDIDLGEIEYSGSAELLKQVWVNILDNAVKFSPKGAALTVSLFSINDSVIFKVKDNGPGMDEKTLERVYDKFFQADTSRSTQGNGLGLTVVKKIIALHNGRINAESHLGAGTTITVTLPKK